MLSWDITHLIVDGVSKTAEAIQDARHRMSHRMRKRRYKNVERAMSAAAARAGRQLVHSASSTRRDAMVELQQELETQVRYLAKAMCGLKISALFRIFLPTAVVGVAVNGFEVCLGAVRIRCVVKKLGGLQQTIASVSFRNLITQIVAGVGMKIPSAMLLLGHEVDAWFTVMDHLVHGLDSIARLATAVHLHELALQHHPLKDVEKVASCLVEHVQGALGEEPGKVWTYDDHKPAAKVIAVGVTKEATDKILSLAVEVPLDKAAARVTDTRTKN